MNTQLLPSPSQSPVTGGTSMIRPDGLLTSTEIKKRYGLTSEQLVHDWMETEKLPYVKGLKGRAKCALFYPAEVAQFFLSKAAGNKQRMPEFVRIASIHADFTTRVRQDIFRADVVRRYKEVLGDGGVMEPVVLIWDGSHHYVADGWYRLVAHCDLKLDEIWAIVIPGVKEDAFDLGALLNARNPEPLSDRDRKEILRRKILRQPELAGQVRALARVTGIPKSTVARMLIALAGRPAKPAIAQPPPHNSGVLVVLTKSQVRKVDNGSAGGVGSTERDRSPELIAGDLDALALTLTPEQSCYREVIQTAVALLRQTRATEISNASAPLDLRPHHANPLALKPGNS